MPQLNVIREFHSQSVDISPNPELATQHDLMGCYIRTYESSKSKPHKPLCNAHAGLLEGDLRTALYAGAWISTSMVAHCSHRGTDAPNRNVGLQAESPNYLEATQRVAGCARFKTKSCALPRRAPNRCSGSLRATITRKPTGLWRMKPSLPCDSCFKV